MVWLPGGTFRMGSDAHYPDEAPAHQVAVDGFWIDATPVTNLQFTRFVKSMGYVTLSERVPNAIDYPAPIRNSSYRGRSCSARPIVQSTFGIT